MNLKEISSAIFLFIRVLTSLGLLFKGYYFLGHLRELNEVILSIFSSGDFIISHYVIFAYLFGGLCLLIGLFSRFSALMILPILFVAIFLYYLPNYSLHSFEALTAFAVFMGLIIVSIAGPGRYSFDQSYVHADESLNIFEENLSPLRQYLIEHKAEIKRVKNVNRSHF